jgi:hypothetical protein
MKRRLDDLRPRARCCTRVHELATLQPAAPRERVGRPLPTFRAPRPPPGCCRRRRSHRGAPRARRPARAPSGPARRPPPARTRPAARRASASRIRRRGRGRGPRGGRDRYRWPAMRGGPPERGSARNAPGCSGRSRNGVRSAREREARPRPREACGRDARDQK